MRKKSVQFDVHINRWKHVSVWYFIYLFIYFLASDFQWCCVLSSVEYSMGCAIVFVCECAFTTLPHTNTCVHKRTYMTNTCKPFLIGYISSFICEMFYMASSRYFDKVMRETRTTNNWVWKKYPYIHTWKKHFGRYVDFFPCFKTFDFNWYVWRSSCNAKSIFFE